MRRVGIYIFEEAEVLDFAGPFEVFSTASRIFRRAHPGQEAPFDVFTVGMCRSPVRARGGLIVTPNFNADDHPPIDVLLIPGGVVTAELQKAGVISWIRQLAQKAEIVATVCTGAFLAGKAGLLEGRSVTTHWEDIGALARQQPEARVLEGRRWIDEGHLITSAGISAGLDMSFHLVARFAGKDLAIRTARQMEYDPHAVF